MNLGRSANVCAILSTTETGYVSGRSQGGMVWVGHTTGLNAAKAGAELLGWRRRDQQDTCAAIAPHQWIFSEDQPHNAGPCIVTGLQILITASSAATVELPSVNLRRRR
jgi:hypothetical protein